MNSVAKSVEVISLTVGMKMDYLVRQSTITRMEVKELEGGNCSIKSIEIDSQGRGGMGSCWSVP